MSSSASWIFTSTPSPGVLLVELNRPKVNAFSTALFLALRSAFHSASDDPAVRCVVLSSALDKGLTAGLDLTDDTLHRTSTDPARTALLIRDYMALLQSCVSALQECTKPVIAAVHGLCLGAGIDLMSACDVRYCASNSVFSIKEVDIGLAADIGSLQRLPKTTANASLLYELALTARNFSPAEAVTLGLVSRVVEGEREGVVGAAVETAKVIASKSPVAVLSTKHLLNYSREHTVRDGLEYTQAWNMGMIQTSDVSKAFEAFTTKKQPVFDPLGKAKL
ncbi:hypothetical protein JCM10207_007238 [Rhodosporidiobolus poonsookiae]